MLIVSYAILIFFKVGSIWYILHTEQYASILFWA